MHKVKRSFSIPFNLRVKWQWVLSRGLNFPTTSIPSVAQQYDLLLQNSLHRHLICSGKTTIMWQITQKPSWFPAPSPRFLASQPITPARDIVDNASIKFRTFAKYAYMPVYDGKTKHRRTRGTLLIISVAWHHGRMWLA